MSRIVVYTIASIVAFAVFAILFVVISVVWNWFYYTVSPGLVFSFIDLPGPVTADYRGISGVVEIVIYILFILAAILALILLVTELVAGWPFDGRNRRQRSRATS